MDKKLIIIIAVAIIAIVVIGIILMTVLGLGAVFFLSEAPGTNSQNGTNLPNGTNSQNGTSVQNGTSMETAIIMQETTSDEGISAEYDWLRANGCPNNGGVFEVEMQELDEDDEGHLYDVLHAVCSDGTVIQYYFNIDNFFGNWLFVLHELIPASSSAPLSSPPRTQAWF